MEFGKFSFSYSINYDQVWSPGWDLLIRLYLKISEDFMRLIHKDRFWFVHIPFSSMLKFQFLAQFPVDHLLHSFVSYPMLLLRLLATFAYDVINSSRSSETLFCYFFFDGIRFVYMFFFIIYSHQLKKRIFI